MIVRIVHNIPKMESK